MKAAESRLRLRQQNDVHALGQKVAGFDAHRYYDQQEQQAAQVAATRWPRLALWLGYAGDGGTSSGAGD